MIVVDTSAIMAILLNEKQAGEFAHTIEECGLALVSAGSAIELAAAASRSEALLETALDFLRQPWVRVEPVDTDQVTVAAAAYCRFGKGHHPAGLNFGDVFAYALARSRNLPLLYQGDDFSRTDIVPPSSTSLGESPWTSRDSSVIHRRSAS